MTTAETNPKAAVGNALATAAWSARADECLRSQSVCPGQSPQSGRVASSVQRTCNRSDSDCASEPAGNGPRQLDEAVRPPRSFRRAAKEYRAIPQPHPNRVGFGQAPTSHAQRSSLLSAASVELRHIRIVFWPRHETDLVRPLPRKTPRCRRKPLSRCVVALFGGEDGFGEPAIMVFQIVAGSRMELPQFSDSPATPCWLGRRREFAEDLVQRFASWGCAFADLCFLRQDLNQLTPFRQRQLPELLQDFIGNCAHVATIAAPARAINPEPLSL